jgi:hypothetical protein
MLTRQKQVIEALQRVQAFLALHPPPETPGYATQKKLFDEIVASLTDNAENQVSGRRLRHAEVPRQVGLKKALREQHLAPIAQIARATLSDLPAIDKALRMPSESLSALRLVAEASAMRAAAAQYEAKFVEAGRPADFVKQLDDAIEAVRLSMIGKARYLGQQVGGSAGIERDLKRGRQSVEVLDTIVKDAFRGDKGVLAEWRSARRVRAVPGGTNGTGSEAAPHTTAPVRTPVSAPTAPVAAAGAAA